MNLTPITDKSLETRIISLLRAELRASYPSRWATMDSRVGSFLDLYIRLMNTVKIGLSGNAQKIAQYMQQQGSDFQLSADFVNALQRLISRGNVPTWLGFPVGAARATAAKNAIIRAENAEIDKQNAENPGIMDRILGSWEVAAKALPWLLIAGVGAYVYFSYGRPAAQASKRFLGQ